MENEVIDLKTLKPGDEVTVFTKGAKSKNGEVRIIFKRLKEPSGLAIHFELFNLCLESGKRATINQTVFVPIHIT